MICLTCHYANEDDARFCEQCGQALNITCPSCGSSASAVARFCRHGGQPLLPSPSPTTIVAATALPPPRPSSLDERLDQLQRYLPAHLANKILANRGRLAGERKLVTVLFADIAGYTALSAQVGEEALFALMDELYELLIHEVHRYEGTMNELTGDGLVAFFGAPLAVEQAPQRAVRAALALQQAVMYYSAHVERERGVRLQLRVGLNTGPVIVGTVGDNLRMDYKAIGNTVNLAARMEQTAAPGTIQLTEHTYSLRPVTHSSALLTSPGHWGPPRCWLVLPLASKRRGGGQDSLGSQGSACSRKPCMRSPKQTVRCGPGYWQDWPVRSASLAGGPDSSRGTTEHCHGASPR